ncbi:MAG: AcrR family transcriptional regulator [Bradymonadia bacterium]|jgi:AcrR family transcriptional regulator
MAAIESATLELVRASGVAGTTIAEICSTAGIAKGSFYRYFESKASVGSLSSHRSRQRSMRRETSRPLRMASACDAASVSAA